MRLSTILLGAILIGCLYQGYRHFSKDTRSKKDNPPAMANQNPRDKFKSNQQVKNPDTHVMKDKRINPIAGEKTVVNVQNTPQKFDPIRRRVPENLERILQYELHVWSRGLTDDEVNTLKDIWSKYQSGEKFSQEDAKKLDELDKRNILNAIRVSKPSIIRSQEELSRSEDREREVENRRLQQDYAPELTDDYSNDYREEPVDNFESEPRDDYSNDYREDPPTQARTLEAPIDTYEVEDTRAKDIPEDSQDFYKDEYQDDGQSPREESSGVQDIPQEENYENY